MRTVLVRVCRALLDAARTMTRAIRQDQMPSPLSPTAVEENIAWGKAWIAAAVVALLSGETVAVGRLEAVMLVLFVASVVVSRGRPRIVYQATHTT